MPFTNNPWTAADLSGREVNPQDPSYYFEPITKSDVVGGNFSGDRVTRFVSAAADGTFSVVRPDDTAVSIMLFKGYNPIQIKRVNVAGSDAVDLWAYF